MLTRKSKKDRLLARIVFACKILMVVGRVVLVGVRVNVADETSPFAVVLDIPKHAIGVVLILGFAEVLPCQGLVLLSGIL